MAIHNEPALGRKKPCSTIYWTFITPRTTDVEVNLKSGTLHEPAQQNYHEAPRRGALSTSSCNVRSPVVGRLGSIQTRAQFKTGTCRRANAPEFKLCVKKFLAIAS